LSWRRALGLFGGLSTGQLMLPAKLPCIDERRKEGRANMPEFQIGTQIRWLKMVPVNSLG